MEEVLKLYRANDGDETTQELILNVVAALGKETEFRKYLSETVPQVSPEA